MARKQAAQKQLKNVLSKDIGLKNPIFTLDQITQLHALFSLYADPRQRRADVRDLLVTASTLGLDSKYQIVFRVFQEINDSANGAALDFQQFLKEITAKIGCAQTEEGRKANFALLDVQGKGQLDFDDIKYINQQLKYGYSEQQLQEILHSVAGFDATTITWDKFNKFIEKKVQKKKVL